MYPNASIASKTFYLVIAHAGTVSSIASTGPVPPATTILSRYASNVVAMYVLRMLVVSTATALFDVVLFALLTALHAVVPAGGIASLQILIYSLT